MQPHYAEPVDLYAPVPHGSLTIMRAESAICRAVAVDENITLLISAGLATASRLLREPWGSLWQASVTTVVGRAAGDGNVLLLIRLAALPWPRRLSRTSARPRRLVTASRPQPGPAGIRRVPRGRRIGERAIAPLEGGQPAPEQRRDAAGGVTW
jgi:hypothetical protein